MDYAGRKAGPQPREIFAFIEVSDSSAAFDRGRKMRMYGRNRVPEYVMLDLRRNRLTFFRQPSDVGYTESRDLAYGEVFFLAALPDVAPAADDFLDPRRTDSRP